MWRRAFLTMVLMMAGCSRLQIKPGEQIVAMGDSITQAGGYLRIIDGVLARQYPEMNMPKIVNVGIGGQKAEDMVARFERDVVARQPTLVTINVGINDVWHRLDKPHDAKVLAAYRQNVERMVQMAQKAGSRVLLLSPTVIQEDPSSEGNQRLALYVAAGKDIAARTHCRYVDLHALFLTAIENLSKPGHPATTRPVNHLTTDGVHMKPLGDEIMAIGVLRALSVPDEKTVDLEAMKLLGK